MNYQIDELTELSSQSIPTLNHETSPKSTVNAPFKSSSQPIEGGFPFAILYLPKSNQDASPIPGNNRSFQAFSPVEEGFLSQFDDSIFAKHFSIR